MTRMLTETWTVDAISEGSMGSIRNLAGGHLYDILAKNLDMFCLCPENLVKLDLGEVGWLFLRGKLCEKD